MKQYVVTISRQFGSMGRTIAQLMAWDLGVNFYDRDIVEETANGTSDICYQRKGRKCQFRLF